MNVWQVSFKINASPGATGDASGTKTGEGEIGLSGLEARDLCEANVSAGIAIGDPASDHHHLDVRARARSEELHAVLLHAAAGDGRRVHHEGVTSVGASPDDVAFLYEAVAHCAERLDLVARHEEIANMFAHGSRPSLPKWPNITTIFTLDMSKKSIYLDYAATTPVDPVVLEAMLPYLEEYTANDLSLIAGWGNPGSLHSFGQRASTSVFSARQVIAKELNCHYSEVVFTGSATEANNLAIRGALRTYLLRSAESQKGKVRIIVSAIEHESILATVKDLEGEGVEVVIIPVDKNGLVDFKKLKGAINERTALVSVMYANNEIGTIQPIAEISKMIRKIKNVKSKESSNHSPCASYPLLHCDAVQAFQYIECDVEKLGIDLLTLSAHKIYGPKGIGALYVRKDFISKSSTINLPLSTILTGGGQEQGLRSGTENVPAIVGFAKAVELVASTRAKEAVRIVKLRDQAWQGIKKIFPKAQLNGISGVRLPKLRLPNNLNFSVPGISGEQLLVALDLRGVAISSGSACTARSISPSHVLLAMDSTKERAKNSLRITLGRQTSKTEINTFLKILRGERGRG